MCNVTIEENGNNGNYLVLTIIHKVQVNGPCLLIQEFPIRNILDLSLGVGGNRSISPLTDRLIIK